MSSLSSRARDLMRIRTCLQGVEQLVRQQDWLHHPVSFSSRGDPTTALDHAINHLLLETLREAGEGWLSEETEDNAARRESVRVWVVDPIDGTREFVKGIPEWCVSVGLVEDHRAVAGGILNPMTGETFLGSIETGLETVGLKPREETDGEMLPRMLVSRREHHEGKWRHVDDSGLVLAPIGSIAYRLALVAAGRGDATCTLGPRSEWDVAAGVALVLAAGGKVHMLNGTPLRFNQEIPRYSNIFAAGPSCPPEVSALCAVSDNHEAN